QREELDPGKRVPVGDERQVLVDATEAGAQLHENSAERVEIRTIGREAEIEVERVARRPVQHGGDASDDHVVHAPSRHAAPDLVRLQLGTRTEHAAPGTRACLGCGSRPGTWRAARRATAAAGWRSATRRPT